MDRIDLVSFSIICVVAGMLIVFGLLIILSNWMRDKHIEGHLKSAKQATYIWKERLTRQKRLRNSRETWEFS
jgi:undecaprenyl pyrophosphate phosphatase UppP